MVEITGNQTYRESIRTEKDIKQESQSEIIAPKTLRKIKARAISEQAPMWTAITLVLITVTFLVLLPDRQPIVGAFYIPGYPLFGNTWQVLQNPSQVFSNWVKHYGYSSFVVYLGYTPVLIVNSFADVHELWLLHSIALGSRPTLHTFHNVVSAVQGLTVGSTPAGDSYKRKKKCLSQQLSAIKVSGPDITETIDLCSRECLNSLLSSALQERLLLVDFQYYVLSAAIRFTYGLDIDCHGADEEFANNIITTENQIIRMRSLIGNFQDYLPICQFYPIRRVFESRAMHWGSKRDAYMRKLYSCFLDNLNKGKELTSHSMLASILREKFSAMSLSETEIQSICLTMVSAGLDNSALTLDHLMGQLSQPGYGYNMQNRLYNLLIDASNGSVTAAWRNASISADCTYATALLQEALRFFSVLPLGLPRKTLKSVSFGGMLIPANTTVIMNNYAANHDPSVFDEPFVFKPTRWLDDQGNLIKSKFHFSFGAGSRKCAGNHLAMKEMYTLLCRIILLFHIRELSDSFYHMDLDPFAGNLCPNATSFEPREFRVSLQPRYDLEYSKNLLSK